MEYGGFWRRLGAFLFDQITMILSLAVIGGVIAAAIFIALRTVVPTHIIEELSPLLLLPIMLVYNVFLVARYGSTPGMWLFKLKLRMQDGSAVTSRATWLRYSVVAGLSLLADIPRLWELLLLFLPATLTQGASAFGYASAWEEWFVNIVWIWMLSEFIALMLNKQRRALQDFVAGTVVVKLSAKAPQTPPLATTPT